MKRLSDAFLPLPLLPLLDFFPVVVQRHEEEEEEGGQKKKRNDYPLRDQTDVRGAKASCDGDDGGATVWGSNSRKEAKKLSRRPSWEMGLKLLRPL